MIGNIHYSDLTDLAWNSNEKLMVSSRDGFITLIKFSPNEFGEVLLYEEIPKINQPLFEWMHNF